MTTTEKVSKFATPNFGARDLVLVSGKGCKVYSEDGKEYLDFGAGIAVNCLGHANPRWVKAVAKQAELLSHCCNLYLTKPNAELCENLSKELAMAKFIYAIVEQKQTKHF
jgi:acetylornithine/succinyldiaminopimelate/putrescine aminotransferase